YRAPGNAVEEILAGIYAQVLGVERVGVDESFFDLGGDSISSMQVVARARAAGVLCRPRDVFVEQTVARLALVAGVVGDEAVVADDGVGAVALTPIMGWLAGVDGPVDEFNQTVVVSAPAGASVGDVAVLLQALVDRHAMLRLRVGDDGAGGWVLWVPEAGSVDVSAWVEVVEVLGDEAVLRARSRLNPAAGVMVSALWVSSTAELVLIIHHLAVDGVSWRILLEDLNIAWAQHRGGQPVQLPAPGTSFSRWASLLADYARGAEVVETAPLWRQVGALEAVLPAVQPQVDTYARAGQLSVSVDVETTAMLLAPVPAAFRTGVQDILLIAFALALAEFLGTGRAPIGIDVEGHGRAEELIGQVDLSRTVGWFTTKYPVAINVGGLSWAQVITGEAALGAVIKQAKEQLRALPDGLTYGLLRYVNPETELPETDPPIGFNYLGRLGGSPTTTTDQLWQLSPAAVSVTATAAAVPIPLAHTLELNAVTIDTDHGPTLHTTFTWAPSALQHTHITHLSQLWTQALTGICTHTQKGGGGLTPSDIAPAHLTQQQIDDLYQTHDIADILPLTPLQQGLLFHAKARQAEDNTYAVQLAITISGPLDASRLREAIHTVIKRHPNLAARFHAQFSVPVQTIPADPIAPWRSDELVSEEQIERLCAEERATVCELAGGRPFRVALIRTAPDRHRFVLTFHHIVMDGWSLPILLGEIFASYHGQRLPACPPYRRFFDWLAGRDLQAAENAWRQILAGYDTPTLVGRSDRSPLACQGVETFRMRAETSRALGALARGHHTTVNVVLQAAWAQLLMWLTGQSDVVFGAVVSGRPVEVAGADSMVGLFINTVPVRATMTATTTTSELLEQLQRAYNDTLEHQHLALNEIHRITGHDQLFDTLLVYENYPIDTAALSGFTGLAMTEIQGRESTHYPLTMAVRPGDEWELRVEFRTDVFDAGSVEVLVGRLERVLVAMAADPGRPVSSVDVVDDVEQAHLDVFGNCAVLTRAEAETMSIPAVFAERVAQLSEAVAVTSAGRSLTYGELDEAANRLAHLLVGCGAGPGRCVGLLFSRSVEAIVAMVGVLKSGAAYLPIDPMMPADRIAFMLADATPVAVLTTGDLAGRLDGSGLRVIDIHDGGIDDQPGVALRLPGGEDIAYVIYTSGTTGAPKGVAVTHQNVTQLLASLEVGLPGAGVWAQCHSLAFDASVEEIFGALLNGGRVVVVPEAVAASPEDLRDLLVAEGVDVLSQTPSVVEALAPDGLDDVSLLVAGEPCPAEVVDRWAPGRVMVNAYGPTETTICASRTAALVAGLGVPPIGSPVVGAALFVLDQWLRRVPVGVVGE
ncbi:condensation domain-containing protein, partial [Mycolicibacterium celeriflavum]|uniref:condensation domain-containing protein n=1 Tax=Mycolicibacterium celeriflavum TaxID=1249101 RepID=UPI003CEAD009